MITWMQRHKKYLIVTIWISTIAFIGAGFVGWGQYSYGDKAGAIAKVGNIEISQGELQKSYSRLYAQYNKVFQGNFDEEKAKQFGLQKQALQQLVQEALILNLAKSYDLIITDEEMINVIKLQKAFYKDGVFDKATYKQVLSQNRLTAKEYESELKKELLIQKTLSLLPGEVSKNEKNIVMSMLSIADKINYKVLTLDDVKVDTSDAKLKEFWKNTKNNYKTEIAYSIKYIKQEPVHKTYDQNKIAQYYQDNRTHFKAQDGKILPLEEAKTEVIKELDKKATKDQSLRTYIAFKKDKLPQDVKVQTATISKSNNPFTEAVLTGVAKLSHVKPYMKPVEVNGVYYIVSLVQTIPSQVKDFEQAKADVLPLYIQEMKQQALLQTANSSVDTFTGTTSDFINVNAVDKLTGLSKVEAADFLQKLFVSDKKKAYITLNDGKIVLYNILEQKMLANTNMKIGEEITKLKSAMFNEGLIKTLQEKYKTEIFVKGL
ncbi:peptidylprolyl isomerase [Sulfurimonas sp.]|uniref:peptidylprolyl isomerase n=1 Tax=Sulfurimonas sp. TaxID=2022749 RepID=UPI0026105DA6|nr:peptidylprolyl isomerase [Sulfurimonas sp.]